jgi:transposase
MVLDGSRRTVSTAAALCCCWRCWPIGSRFWMVHEPRSSAMLELTDSAFSRVQRLLPADSRRGKPWRDHRQVLGGILWKLPTGRPWRDVPGRFGPWQTCYGRLRRWQGDGTWPRGWALLAAGGELGSGDGRGGQLGQALLAAAPVAAAGAGLMAAPPPRPPQHLPHRRRCPPHQPDQQPTRLRGRDPDQVRPWRLWRFCAVSRPPCLPGRWQRPGRGPPPGTPGRPGPGSRADTSHPSDEPGSGPGQTWSLAAWKHSSTAQRIPATLTSSAKLVRAGPKQA